ncbi:copper chaperone [Pseudomethylobacillus aquaticus]|uniref:Copper chaperone n=1 Tax=Pseudomethylobacillus aquaticus TaxID=2676064 RepID=A0A3N0UVE2_9PROT|nr:heavy-metal-associated domain-containing protein [Pseudomethylobacillus aquaticus]ROH84490.1 copper chaperone [Pseudomethylobacillus aquaticus]
MTTYKVEKISCMGCVNAITRVLQQGDATARVDADLTSKLIHVEASLSVEEVQQRLERAGYPAVLQA